MRIVFMGTPDFAVTSFEGLLKNGYEIAGVFTQPDKPKGRKRLLTPPPVKEAAVKHNIPVFQPASMKDGEAERILSELKPDIIVVVAYGKILPKAVLQLPPLGCVNVHGSLLPKYRGAAPIQWAVLNGDKTAGVTTMLMDEGLDTGDMLMKAETEIGENENYGSLFLRLADIGADLLDATLKAIEAGTIKREKQDEASAVYAPMLDKTMCPIDWNHSAQQIHNQVRGLSPWPIACAQLGERAFKIHASRLADLKADGKAPGEVLESGKRLVVACGSGSLELIEVHFDGGKRMAAQDFMRGHPIAVGTVLS